MDLNTWSFALSVLGAVLGIVSAYAKLKTFSLKVFKATGEAAARSLERDHAQADMFLSQPAALVAFITYRVLLGTLIIILSMAFLNSGGSLYIKMPDTARDILQLLLSGLCANLLSSPLMASWQVYRRAIARAARDS